MGTWNICTLMNQDNISRPQRRTALIAKEQSRCDINIPAINETRLAEEGSLTESGSGYTFFWKDKTVDEDRIHRVGFAIKSGLLKQIPILSTVKERLMKLCLPILHHHHNVYAPTMTCKEKIREQFCVDFDTELCDMPATDKFIILDDFRARVGRDEEQWRGVIGKHGAGKMNNNALLLPSTTCWSATPSSSCLINTRHYGCTRIQNSVISLTT